jgi:heme/copper-type cytochrome/quinol oxidase subunit 1
MSTIQKQTTIYERFAGLCAVLAGVGSLLYAITFIILVIGERAPQLGMLLSSLFLTLIGLFSTIVLVAIYNRLRETDATFALLVLLLGIAGALGSAVHGGYDLLTLEYRTKHLGGGLSYWNV